ncbi:MAG: alpha/beta hydrolase [Gammaproteobacteria bacterium]|nr:alpha/beta hydrolase [Gammaproteobacteria bacterium]MXY57627.1 alpha/beta hydrolase [Gammaproteobacteria bacterium]MYF31361.1 alpha/beta hydrolase [Gammaproteobacteria bacterium]MYK46061.1 alpha/beta hydrolase [Gammaproteobacteria bacterium]
MTSDVWKIPEPTSTIEVRLDDDIVTTVRRHGNPRGPRLVLSHGNGLAIDLYYPFWRLLLDDFDLFVYDLRNHGWNRLGPQGSHNIPVFIRDQGHIIECIDRTFGAKPKIGVYHSLSALVTLLSLSSVMSNPSSRDARFKTLILFDPPLFRPRASEAKFDDLAEALARRTRKRHNHFRDLDQFVELLNYSPSFARVLPGVRELMARTTLRRSAAGDHFELRCPPDYEAQIVEYVRSYAGLVDFEHLPCNVKVLGADPTLPFAYLPTFDLVQMDTVDYDFLPEATHYLQLEQPAECVAVMREYLSKTL